MTMITTQKIADAIKKLECTLYSGANEKVQAIMYGLECNSEIVDNLDKYSAYKWALEKEV